MLIQLKHPHLRDASVSVLKLSVLKHPYSRIKDAEVAYNYDGSHSRRDLHAACHWLPRRGLAMGSPAGRMIDGRYYIYFDTY